MTVTTLKTVFVKADALQIYYREYKNYDSFNFNQDLKNKLNSDIGSNKDYNKFQTILCEVLDKHAPIKKKCVSANNSPFMTKPLRKMIMNRSRCKNTYFKNKTVENWEKYRKLRNECVKLTKKVKREYFESLNINSITDNKKFWKAIKPHFSDKDKRNAKIILVENEDIISDNKNIAKTMNEYFVNITKDLNIPGFNIEKIPKNMNMNYIDPIDKIIYEYSKHPSILNIKQHVNLNNIFTFETTDETEIVKEIIELNSKKATGADGIPSKIPLETTF